MILVRIARQGAICIIPINQGEHCSVLKFRGGGGGEREREIEVDPIVKGEK